MVELAAINLLPAPMFSSSSPKVEAPTGVPESLGLVGPINFGAHNSNFRIALHHFDHLGYHIGGGKRVVVEQEGKIETARESIAQGHVVCSTESIVLV